MRDTRPSDVASSGVEPLNQQSNFALRASARGLVTALALAVLAASCEEPLSLPPPPEPTIDSPAAAVTALERAYRQRNPELLQSLLANEHDANADYLFLLSAPTDRGETQWNCTEEARIHQRMFRPDQADPAVPSELWLQSIQVTLTPLEGFQVRQDLYSANAGQDGKLDSHRWRVMDARYSTYVLFDLAGWDYKVEGEANFVVLEDLTKRTGEAGKFLFYIWEDLGRGAEPILRSQQASWGNLKALYR